MSLRNVLSRALGGFLTAAKSRAVSSSIAISAWLLFSCTPNIRMPIVGRQLASVKQVPTVFVISGIPSSLVAGASQGFQLIVEDGSGNVVTGYTGTVNFSSTDLASLLPGTYTFQIADQGVKNFTTSLYTAGTQSLTATDQSNPLLTGNQTGILVMAAAPDHLALVSGDAQTATVNTTIALAPKVQVFDAYGNVVNGAILQFTVNSGGGSVGSTTVTSDPLGNATTSYQLGTVSGNNNNTMTVSGLTTLPGVPATMTFTESATPGVAAQIVFNSSSSSAVVNGCGNTQGLTTEDSFGNVSAVTALLTVQLSGGSGHFYSDSGCTTLLAAQRTTVASGSSSSAAIYYGNDATPELATLSAADVALSLSTGTQAFSNMVQFILAGATTINAGVCSGPYTITAHDANNALITIPTDVSFSANGDDAVGTYSDPGCSTGAAPLVTNGTNTGTFYVMTTVVASRTGYPTVYNPGWSLGLQTPNIGNFTVIPAAANSMVFTGPTYLQMGVCSGPYVLTTTDTYGNLSPVSGNKSVTLTLPGSSGAFSDSTCGTSLGGTVTVLTGNNSVDFYFQYTGGVNGPQTLTAHEASLGTAIFTEFNQTSLAGIAGFAGNCALLSGSNGIRCWGDNGYGQFGDGTTTSSLTPVAAILPATFIQIGSDGHTVCGLDNTGIPWCWGYGYEGEVGDNSTAQNHVNPEQVVGITTATALTVGAVHSCVIKSDQTVWCWGQDGSGQLGNNSTSDSAVPVQVSGLTSVVQANAGNYDSCAVKSDGTAWCWGTNGNGELGNGTTISSLVPVQVSGISNVAQISTSTPTTCALKSDGTVWCWGNPGANGGSLGNGAGSSLTPVQVTGLSSVVQIATVGGGACAVKSDKTTWCWGNVTSLINSSTPVQFAPAVSADAVIPSAGLCVLGGGNLVCSGWGNAGALGNGVSGQYFYPLIPMLPIY